MILYFDESRAVAFRSNHVRSFFELKIQTPWGPKMRRITNLVSILLVLITLGVGPAVGADQPTNDSLSSWNDGAAKQAIVAFVAKVGEDLLVFMSLAERVRWFRRK
jgi:hypothetical protein